MLYHLLLAVLVASFEALYILIYPATSLLTVLLHDTTTTSTWSCSSMMNTTYWYRFNFTRFDQHQHQHKQSSNFNIQRLTKKKQTNKHFVRYSLCANIHVAWHQDSECVCHFHSVHCSVFIFKFRLNDSWSLFSLASSLFRRSFCLSLHLLSFVLMLLRTNVTTKAIMM